MLNCKMVLKLFMSYKHLNKLSSNRYLYRYFQLISPKFLTPQRFGSSSVNLKELDDYRELKINNILLNKYVKVVEAEYNQLLGSKDDKSKKQIMKIEPVIHFLNERRNLIKNIISLSELVNNSDESLKMLAKDEAEKYEEDLEKIEDKLISALLPETEDDECNAIILEVKAGVGGQEAMLFAKEIFEMYMNFAAQYKGWQVEIADLAETDIGGIRHGSLSISGNSVYQFFKYEGGVHRVQRVPATEKGGRIHTSTVSVVTLPQPTDIQINLQQKDLRIETKRASGAGGQHVNTTDSAVRITHIPTGISVECQVDRSQLKNKRLAMTKLKTLLYQKELETQIAEIDATKKSQVRSNFRNEKIRTYNFTQDRISDHRIQGNIHNIKSFMEGSHALEELIMHLDKHFKLDELLQRINKAC